MKKNSFKKRILSIVIFTLGVCLLAPAAGYASENNQVASSKFTFPKITIPKITFPKITIPKIFPFRPAATSSIPFASSTKKFIKPVSQKIDPCAVYSDKFAKINQQAVNNQAKLDTKRAEQLAKFYDNWAKGDQKLVDFRLQTDKRRAELIAKWQEKIASSTKKAALDAFKTAIDKAAAERRAAIDTAMSAYKTAFDKVFSDRKDAVNQATDDYKAAVQDAYAQALADCQANVDKKTIHKNLNNDLKAAKNKFNEDRQNVNEFRNLISPLIKVRQQAVANAVKVFQNALDQAKVDLKDAFKK